VRTLGRRHHAIAFATAITTLLLAACGPAGPRGPDHPSYARFAPSAGEEGRATRARPLVGGDPLAVPDTDPAVVERLTTAISAYAAETGAPAVTITALVPGTEVLRTTVGAAARPTDEPYPVHSVTKMVLTIAVMRLHERGLIDVDAPIGPLDVVGGEALEEVTWWDLLSHRVRLADYRDLLADGEVVTAEEVATRVLAEGPVEVASTASYSNSGYVLLGLALEEVSGEPWEQVLQHEVLDPAGMVGTSVAPPEAAGSRHGSGALLSTTDDLVRLAVAALRDGRLLDEGSLTRMVEATPHSPGPGLWVWCPCVDDHGVQRATGLGHPGHSTYLTYLPAADVVVALDRGDSLWDDPATMPRTEELIDQIAVGMAG
jgi:CubicO group peptidase (beta-lactamase class C family)